MSPVVFCSKAFSNETSRVFDGPTSLKIRRAQDYESRRVALLAEVRESRREMIKKENRHKEFGSPLDDIVIKKADRTREVAERRELARKRREMAAQRRREQMEEEKQKREARSAEKEKTTKKMRRELEKKRKMLAEERKTETRATNSLSWRGSEKR